MRSPTVKFTINARTGVLTIEDDTLGKRDVAPGAVNGIRDQLNYLRECQRRNSSPKPQLLKEDIRAYELLLSQPNTEEISDKYYDIRARKPWLTKRQICEELGIWKDQDV